jgi:hypothetical protein
MRAAALVLALVAGCGGGDDGKPAYEGCDLDDPEELCAEGTECVESLIVASGNGYCTTDCIVGEDACPAGAEGVQAECHQPDGATGAQCYVACPDGAVCPLSTTCVTFEEGGAPVELCVPR